jgi:hypothetical protein
MELRSRRRRKRAAGFRSRSLGDAILHGEKGKGSLDDMLDEADGCRRSGADATPAQERAELQFDTRRVLEDLPPDLQVPCAGMRPMRLLPASWAFHADRFTTRRKQSGRTSKRRA